MEILTKQVIKDLFINLNQLDIDFLNNLLINILNKISELFNFSDFSKKNMIGILLLLLPYIDDENPNVYSKITDLNEILYSVKGVDNIDSYILKYDKKDIINTHFKYSYMAIGLFNNNDILLNLYNNNIKLIHTIIEHNYASLIDTIIKINGKMYVNWINIFPLTNYKESYIYKNKKLYIGEYYNIIRNGLYESIKPVKWLIFSFRNKYYLNYIDEVIDIKNITNYNFYTDLPYEEQNKFDSNIRNITNYNIWKHIIIFMVNNYSSKYIIAEDIAKPFILIKYNLSYNDADFSVEDQRIIDSVTDNDVIYFIKNIDTILLWDFLKESFIIFQSTIYYKYLFPDNKFDKNFFYFNNKINLKNIYNIAKSLSHSLNWKLLPTKYSLLSKDMINEFWSKYNNTNSSWLRLSNNIIREQNNNTFSNIVDGWESIKDDIIWDYLVYNGLLTEFKNDKNYFKNNKEKWLSSYYYLTNNKYEEKYIDSIKDFKWYKFYSMDWVSQIGFFHRYFHHKVLYITGATGQGKSTQVPKLFLYALKAFDYKNNGRIISSMPRITPTLNTATRVSSELGVPIEYQYNKDIKLNTSNYQVQYKYQGANHQKKYCNHLSLLFTTDGTLYELVKDNINMKERVFNKKRDKYIYSERNEYDIIIVDEAHEHNTNMDMILTLARNTCLVNDSIKLVITSATMKDDEPIYRAYYRQIDDGQTLSSTGLLINNNYLDRRFHISPPTETTQYEINEYYLAKDITNGDPIIAQYKGYEIIQNICSETLNGDILFFVNGIAEITDAVNYLNNKLAPDIIALPYHAKLHFNYKDIIENIDTRIKTLKIKRNDVNIYWNDKYYQDNTVPDNIYKRCVIIATNAAEASITITSLKFIVDNGYSRVNKYNEKLETSELIVEKISESSRIQRKGRVGRVGGGSVYYIYEKYGRANIKPQYKITNEYNGQIVMDLIKYRETYKVDDMIYDRKGKFYLIHPYENRLIRNINNDIILQKDKIELYFYKTIERLDRDNLLTSKYDIIRKMKKNINNYELTETDNDINLFIAGYAYGVLDDIIGLVTLIKSMNNNMFSLFTKKQNIELNIMYLHKIIMSIKNQFMFKIFDKLVESLNSYNDVVNIYYNNKIRGIDLPYGFDPKLANQLNELYHNGKLNDKTSIFDNNYLFNYYYNEIEKNKSILKKWINNNNYNEIIIFDFLKNFILNKISIYSYKKIYEEESPFEMIDNIKDSFVAYTKEEKILKSFIYAYPLNYCFYKNGSYYVGETKVINRDTNIVNSLLFYYNRKENEISITNKISSDWIKKEYKPSFLFDEIF